MEQGLLRALAGLNVSVLPLFPGATDPGMDSQYYADVDGPDLAEEVRQRALTSGAVAAAYVKPPGEPP